MVMTLVMIGLSLAILMQLAIFCVAVKTRWPMRCCACLFPAMCMCMPEKIARPGPSFGVGTPVSAFWLPGRLPRIEAGLEKARAIP